MGTMGTSLARRLPLVDSYKRLPVLRTHYGKNLHELGERKVAYLSSPYLLHGFGVERFQTDNVVFGYKAVGQLPMEVGT